VQQHIKASTSGATRRANRWTTNRFPPQGFLFEVSAHQQSKAPDKLDRSTSRTSRAKYQGTKSCVITVRTTQPLGTMQVGTVGKHNTEQDSEGSETRAQSKDRRWEPPRVQWGGRAALANGTFWAIGSGRSFWGSVGWAGSDG